MRKLAWIAALLFCGVSAAQTPKKSTRRKLPSVAKVECAPGAICFSGEVREGQEFQRGLDADLLFVLRLPGGFDVVSRGKAACKLSSWVANPPLRAHHATEIDAAYDWTAEQEVQTSPREFRFVTNCADFEALFRLSETDATQYFDQLDSLAKGQGRFWITGSKVTHAHDAGNEGNGAIEWLTFSVEIKLPRR